MAEMNLSAVYAEPGKSLKTEIVEAAIPTPGPGQVLVKLSHSGVCHTDIAFCLWQTPMKVPAGQVGGHEGVGTVVALGPHVTEPAIGTCVGVPFIADACLTCDRCVEGGETSCRSAKVSGYHSSGTFQQYCLASARYTIPVPQGLDPAAAAPLMCGGLTVYTALKRSDVRPGRWVVVCGAGGGLGHLGVQYARAMGGRVVALDAGGKRDLCLELGAEEFLDFTQFEPADLTARIHQITDGGARHVLMCVSSGSAYAQSMSWLGYRGTLLCVGGLDSRTRLETSVLSMIRFEQRVMASKTGTREEARECLALASLGHIKPSITIRTLDELTEVFEDIEGGKVNGRVVIDLQKSFKKAA